MILLVTLVGCTINQNSIEKVDENSVDEIIGEWKTLCTNGASSSFQLTLNFRENGRMTFREEYFYGTNCIVQDTEWVSEYDYSTEGNNLSLSRYHVKMTAQHTDTVDLYNTSGDEWCGIDSWVLNIQKSVTGLDCDAYPTDSDEINTTFTISLGALEINGGDIFEDAEYIKQ